MQCFYDSPKSFRGISQINLVIFIKEQRNMIAPYTVNLIRFNDLVVIIDIFLNSLVNRPHCLRAVICRRLSVIFGSSPLWIQSICSYLSRITGTSSRKKSSSWRPSIQRFPFGPYFQSPLKEECRCISAFLVSRFY